MAPLGPKHHLTPSTFAFLQFMLKLYQNSLSERENTIFSEMAPSAPIFMRGGAIPGICQHWRAAPVTPPNSLSLHPLRRLPWLRYIADKMLWGSITGNTLVSTVQKVAVTRIDKSAVLAQKVSDISIFDMFSAPNFIV